MVGDGLLFGLAVCLGLFGATADTFAHGGICRILGGPRRGHAGRRRGGSGGAAAL